MKTGRFRSFGFMLAVVIGGAVAGWILLPIFIAFGVGIGAAVGREPAIGPVAVAIGYYKVHAASYTQAIIGAILGSLSVMRGVWCERSKHGKKDQREKP
jgi:hypothetical protein